MGSGMERLAIRRVLCPVQLTDFSGGLLAIGSTLTRRYGADLFTVHVLDDDVRRRKEEAVIRLRGLIRTKSGVDPRDVTSVVRRGNPVDEIAAYAERMEADIIVAGRRLSPRIARVPATAGDRRQAAGPDMARAARCAVLTVPTVGDDGPVPTAVAAAGVFKHIVCGVDFSRASLQALSHAIALAREAAGLLTVVHIVAGHATGGSPKHHDRVIRRLDNLIGANARTRFRVRAIVRTGKPVDALLTVVRAEGGDLLVLGATDSRGTGDRESCTATMASGRADCPVLVVPEAMRNRSQAADWHTAPSHTIPAAR